MSQKKAFITGVTGQDGSYMADLLLGAGYNVHALVRRTSSGEEGYFRIKKHFRNAEDKHDNFDLHFGDLADAGSLTRIIKKVQPDEVYHFGAQGSVAVSHAQPEYTANINALGTLRLIDALKDADLLHSVKFAQASSGEIFGSPERTPQNEETPTNPLHVYAASKLFAHNTVKLYRRTNGFFGCNAIFYAHDSPRKDEQYVFKKITQSLVRIKYGLQDVLFLGNMDAEKDWGFAGDYVDAVRRMLQQPEPDDYIIATGKTNTIRDIIREACDLLEIDLEWKGKGMKEVGYDKKTKREVIKISEKFFRPIDPGTAKKGLLVGDIAKARQVLKWEPKHDFRALVSLMVREGKKNLGV